MSGPFKEIKTTDKEDTFLECVVINQSKDNIESKRRQKSGY